MSDTYDLDYLNEVLERSKTAGYMEQNPFFWVEFVGAFGTAAPAMLRDLRALREQLDAANSYVDQYQLEAKAKDAEIERLQADMEQMSDKHEEHAGALTIAAACLSEDNKAMRAMLTSIQWLPTDCPEAGACPVCQRWDPEGHAPDCALARMINT